MAIWELKGDSIKTVEETSFGAAGIREREDLQRILRENIAVVAPDLIVIGEEYGDWSDSRRRIDLLALDKQANLVVIELKRTEDGGHMDLQAVRYAAMVSALTFARAVEILHDYQVRIGRSGEDAQAQLLEFLEWDEPDEGEFAADVRILLASAEFSKEVTTTVLWLNERGLDIRCIRLKPYRLDGRVLLDVQQVIPLPEAAAYQVQLREKAERKREARASNIDFTRYDLQVAGKTYRGLWKRWMVYRVVRAAIEHAGATPEEISRKATLGDRRWLSVEGHVPAEAFANAIVEQRRQQGKTVRLVRYFTDADELLNVNGRTYAFSNQWGGERAFNTIRAIAEAYPALRVEYHETQDVGAERSAEGE